MHLQRGGERWNPCSGSAEGGESGLQVMETRSLLARNGLCKHPEGPSLSPPPPHAPIPMHPHAPNHALPMAPLPMPPMHLHCVRVHVKSMQAAGRPQRTQHAARVPPAPKGAVDEHAARVRVHDKVQHLGEHRGCVCADGLLLAP